MFRSWRHWVGRTARPTIRGGRRACQRLRVEWLEDRDLPSFVATPIFSLGASSVGGNPAAIAVGDFNSDGKMDVVTANQGSNDISLLLGNGNGTFQQPMNFVVGKSPEAILAVDLNGDGKLDLVTANKSDNTVSVLINMGFGFFRPARSFPAGTGPVALAYGDFNGDHHVDLAVADNGSSTVTLLMGDGTGNFTSGGTVGVGGNPTSVAVADFNDDGKPNIATVSGGFGHLDINLNNGDGTFASPVNYATGFCANTVVVGDFNNDGQPDLAVACTFPTATGVSILLGNPDGTFRPFVQYDAGHQSTATLVVADLNGDGNQDLVTANGQFANNSVSVLLGNGDGTFGTARVYTAGQSPDAVAVGDFNGDDVPDVVTANQGAFGIAPAGSVGLLLGNGDGTLLAAQDLPVRGPGPSVEADFNGDGIPDLAVITTDPSYSGVEIFPGLGNGLFGAPIQTVAINQPTALAVGDFNGDHVPDLAVATFNGVVILLGKSDGTFSGGQVIPAGSQPAWVAVDDFNGDGISDLAVADNGSSGGVSILLGKGDGTFGNATSVDAGGAASSLATGDLNGDHKEDLAVINNSSNTLSILFGKGDGTFGPATSYSTRNGPASVGIGDFNGDGKPDLVVPTFFGPNVRSALSIRLNGPSNTFGLSAEYVTDSRPRGTAIADFNGDHKLDIAVANNFSDDVFVFPGSGFGTFGSFTGYVVGDGPSWLTTADFNGDGQPDLAVVNGNSNTVTLLETPMPATHFRVRVVPVTASAGTAFQVIVTALDAANRLVTNYSGTVSFTSSDSAASLPASYTFTANDQGVHSFTVTLRTVGAGNITVKAGAVSGTTSVPVEAGAATHLQVVTASATAGTPFDVTVTALDAYGNVDHNYQGTVHFSSNDPAKGIILPADYAFTAADHGVHIFTSGVTLLTAGQRTITAIDPPDAPGPTGTGQVMVQAADASSLTITAPTSAIAGTPIKVTVTALDPYNNVATGFAGTVRFSSSDGNAGLPGDYSFVAGDNGIHTFQTVLQTSGPQSLIISAANCSNGEQDGIQVKPGAAAQLAFVGQPANTFAATPVKPGVTVQVEDAFGNHVAAGVKVTLGLANNPGNAVLAGISALTASTGLATFTGVLLNKPGQGDTLIAHAGTGTSAASAPFTIYATTHFGLSVSSKQTQAGTSFQVTVTALDAHNHTDPTYVGTVHFSSSSSPLANLPSDYTFQPSDNGQQTFTVTLNRAGLQSLTVADTTKTTVKGSATVTILPAAFNGFLLSGIPLTATANKAYSFMVVAVDTYGNAVSGYLGTVQFSNAGGTAVLPGPYTFTTKDKGRHVFKATFQTKGSNQSLTVEDASNPDEAGTESGITVR